MNLTKQEAKEFLDALLAADAAAEGDSNDDEIQALQNVRDLAMGLLDVRQSPDGEGYTWHDVERRAKNRPAR